MFKNKITVIKRFRPKKYNKILYLTNKKYMYDKNYSIIKNKIQTFELCKFEIEKNPHLLKYVKDQPVELCLLAVKQDGLTLEYSNEQTKWISFAKYNYKY